MHSFGSKVGRKERKDAVVVALGNDVQAVCYLLYCRRRKISFHLACEHLNAAGYTRRGKPWNNKRANGIVRWWKARLQEDGVMGELCRRALRRSRFKDCPWACSLDEPPKQYQRRLKG
jgi:hypothetical protein